MYLSAISSQLFLYDITSWELKRSYGCYDGSLRDISWSDDSKYMLQVNPKGLIEILSPADYDIRSLQHIPIKDTWSATFNRDGHRNIAIGTKSGNVMIWDTKVKTIVKTFPTPPQQSCVNFISYNAKNTSLAATMHNGDTVIYGLVSNIPVMTVKLKCSKSISAMQFHHESRSLLGLATGEGHVVLRDINTNKDKNYFENVHAAPVSDIAFSLKNKDVLLSSGYDKIMHIYDMRIHNVVSSIRTSYILKTLSINHENQVALGTKSGCIIIYDLRDLKNPFKVIKGQEEIQKVTFQPVKKKSFSVEVSLREEINGSSPLKIQSPVHTRSSDLFCNIDTPSSQNVDVSGRIGNNKEDSFLVMLGLDKSNSTDDEPNKSSLEKGSDHCETTYDESEKNISKISTPLNSKLADNFDYLSPLINTNRITADCPVSNSNISNVQSSNKYLHDIDTEDLKDCMKFIVSDVIEDNRNNFNCLMLALTKQHLFLQKQMLQMNDQLQNVIQNQNDLLEANRKLSLQIDMLKSHQ